MRALLIRHPHIDLILDGKKIWEIRGSRTSVRGTIALVPSGSGTVVGVCNENPKECADSQTTIAISRSVTPANLKAVRTRRETAAFSGLMTSSEISPPEF